MLGALQLLQSWELPGYAEIGKPHQTTRAWFADGEELAEGSIKDWITELRPYLEGQGVSSISAENTFINENEYRVAIDGREFIIYTDVGPDLWEVASRRAMQIVNWLLEIAGSPERGYILYMGGNEGIALFMTTDTYKRLITSPKLDPTDIPTDVGTIDQPIGG